MKYLIDTEKRCLVITENGKEQILPLYSPQSFYELSEVWLKIGWNEKYTYTFSWLGRPIIQLPEDLIRIQELIYDLRPDVIVETGVAHGGSLVFYASLCKAINKGRVIGIDILIHPHNRKAIEEHEVASMITLIEGDSVNKQVIQKVKNSISPNQTVLLILDSCHSKSHVLAEMQAYKDVIKPGSYLVVTDGIMKNLYDTPRGKMEWRHDNPHEAIYDFVRDNKDFVVQEPHQFFNESVLSKNVTHWPSGYLKRIAI